MDENQYRLLQRQKDEIAQNLIGILQQDAEITKLTAGFIRSWVRSGPEGKRKAHFDVWDIVLRNYMPDTMPVLFRSCKRQCDGKITSFTGRLECARRMGGDSGLLIICDTKDDLFYEKQCNRPGEYRHTFYPLVTVIRKGIECGEFRKDVWEDYLGEDEYIMRVSSNMSSFRWNKK
jgi:hypothetical protein